MKTRTSRVGRKPVQVPVGVEVKIVDQVLSVKGPKGNLSVTLHPFVDVIIDGSQVKVQLLTGKKKIITGPSSKLYRSIAGTIRANINNVICGVTQGFERRLLLVGVGYRASVK